MLRILFILLLLLQGAATLTAQVWTEDFETNGLGTLYTSASVFTNNPNAHYNRTNGANISETSGAYYAQRGSFYWAGENQNDATVGGNGLPNKVIQFANINVAGLTGLQFRGLFASGNIGAGYDFSDAFYVEYRMDAGNWTRFLQFSAPSMSSNVGLAYDADLNNIGEGALLTPQFTQYSAPIPVTGTTLQIRITTVNNAVGEEVAFDFLRVYSSNTNVLGCTNPLASNFNPAANVDNNSCVVPGCTDASALNFNANATSNNGSCVYTVPNVVINEIHYNPSSYGSFSDNVYEFIELYNPGSSAVSIAGWRLGRAIDYTFPAGASIAAGGYVLVSPSATTYAGAGVPLFVYTGTLNNSGDVVELYTPQRVLVDKAAYFPTTPWPAGPDGNGPSLELTNPLLDNMNLYNWCGDGPTNGTPGIQNSCYSPVLGCTDATASNYDPAAQANDDSCIYPGCTYPGASNYNATANVDDGSCIYPTVINIPGCTYPNATNYNPVATVENQSCIFAAVAPVLGCTYPNATNYNPNATAENQSCIFPTVAPVLGCTYPNATNYNPNATAENQSCIFPTIAPVLGCTYPNATNYNPNATMENQSCIFPSTTVVYGCTYSNALNYNPNATAEDQSCIFPAPMIVEGCTYPNATNYNPNANTDNQSCVFPSPVVVLGCTYVGATNYNPAANTDDQSCVFPQPVVVLGCTYPNANNFNPAANTDDLSCDFTQPINPCVGDFDQDGVVTVLDLSVFLSIFGLNCN